MAKQVEHLSPHQNGKVLGILFGVVTIAFLVPFSIVMLLSVPRTDFPPLVFLVLLPLGYAVMGYVGVSVGCLAYNALYKYIGGIEFVARETAA